MRWCRVPIAQRHRMGRGTSSTMGRYAVVAAAGVWVVIVMIVATASAQGNGLEYSVYDVLQGDYKESVANLPVDCNAPFAVGINDTWMQYIPAETVSLTGNLSETCAQPGQANQTYLYAIPSGDACFQGGLPAGPDVNVSAVCESIDSQQPASVLGDYVVVILANGFSCPQVFLMGSPEDHAMVLVTPVQNLELFGMALEAGSSYMLTIALANLSSESEAFSVCTPTDPIVARNVDVPASRIVADYSAVLQNPAQSCFAPLSVEMTSDQINEIFGSSVLTGSLSAAGVPACIFSSCTSCETIIPMFSNGVVNFEPVWDVLGVRDAVELFLANVALIPLPIWDQLQTQYTLAFVVTSSLSSSCQDRFQYERGTIGLFFATPEEGVNIRGVIPLEGNRTVMLVQSPGGQMGTVAMPQCVYVMNEQEQANPATPTPTPEPTTTPGPSNEPEPTPTPVCIDAEWIEAQGLDKVHAHDGVGPLLCLTGADDLPCGTPDHILEVESPGAGTSALRTYAEVCSERDCTTKLGRYNGVLHSDAHKLPSQHGLRLTTVSHRGTRWSAIENRIVVAAQKLRSVWISHTMTYLQRKNSVS
ncbi:hypothetical protein FVE85_7933 [Porphyridium purpureum]|uniref:Uncharacterized protein n=1 Tax=Porphyridium purpureum TaxID=35688 RepID=A0A5J4YLW8_PORPP|nr:hypothetical protein FVE85_7933 [Porphyridium purpureum]|eukprot:POR3909..scf295_9